MRKNRMKYVRKKPINTEMKKIEMKDDKEIKNQNHRQSYLSAL